MVNAQGDPFAPFVPRLVRSWPADRGHQRRDGTLVFVDISGFTALSERLARKGRVGAEEVAAALSVTFTELLTIADRLGGDLLKFGGDALLMLFTGDGHAVRATHAAAEMRTALSAVGRVSTPSGTVRLRMSVGVHSGPLDFFLVGSAHRELIVTGPGATTTVGMEGTAEAGEILLSRATADLIGARHLGAPKGAGFLLRRMPPHQEWIPDPETAISSAEAFVPVGLRPFVGSVAGEGEHRLMTVAFVKFTDTDTVLAAEGPDGLHRRLDALTRLVQEAAVDTEVTFLASDIDGNGGKIILTAGAPVTTGTDEERMLRTVRRIADEGTMLPLKIGVNRGPAFSGDVGAAFRRTYTVIGDAVNLAARVMTRAEPGAVLATADVLDRSATLFEVTELEPFMVKGKSAPVRAWRVGGMSGQRHRVDRARLPLFGREEELTPIAQAVSREDPTGLVDIVGPAGIGKSRLVREAQQRSADAVDWHFSACEQYEMSTPYFPFRRLLWSVLGVDAAAGESTTVAELRQRAKAAAPDLVPWLPLLGTVMNVPVPDTPQTSQLDPKFRIVKLHEAVHTLVATTAFRNRFVLLIEDAQWMDDASRDLVMYLANAAIGTPWLVMVARRPDSDEPSTSGHLDIRLGPLGTQAARELARHAVEGRPLLDHQIDAIVQRAAGNPLFLLELVAAAESGATDLPDSIDALVLSRIDRLDPDLRRVLRYSAAAGTTFDPDIVTEAIGDELPAVAEARTWQALGEFLVRRKSGQLRFRQAMFRDVAYEGLPYRTRRFLHERFGETLERRAGEDAEDQAPLLALHFFRAEAYDRAWRYSVVAGDRAAAQYANNEAGEFYTQALAAARRLPGLAAEETFRVAEELGRVCTLAGTLARADTALDQARRLAPGEVQLARICNQKGVVRRHMGKYPQALRWLTRGRKLLAGRDEDEARRVRAALAVGYAGIRFRQGRYRDCIAWCERALPDAEAAGDRPTLAHAYFLLDYAYDSLNELEEHGTYWKDALAIYEELDDHVGQANVLNNQGVKAYFKGDWRRAVEFYRRSEKARERAGDVIGAATALNNIAEILVAQGDLEGAADMLNQARTTFQATNYQLGELWTAANLGRVASLQGKHEDAMEALHSGLRDLEEMNAEAFVVETGLRIAEAHLLAGDPDAALSQSEAMLTRTASRPGSAVLRSGLHRARGYARLMQRDAHDAHTEFTAALSLARAADAQYEVALTLQALGRWADFVGAGDADDYATAAQEIFDLLDVEATPELPLPATR
jgi:class 3 adenylate cyclase/tetratricopeptide (TPR) repeat protein